ncbi:MAG: GNAT family N-acetyltransferase [Melioribacteraceae bacterium]|nr:GNAT family N-acetyltransferase [Melioribacteraceae bacterium]
MLTLKRISCLDELIKYKEKWIELEKEHFLFQSWNWNFNWIKSVLKKNKKIKLDVWIIFENKEVIAILPFFKEQMFFPKLYIIQFLGHRMSYHNDILLSSKVNNEKLVAILEMLKQNIGFFSTLLLRHLSANSPLVDVLDKQNMIHEQCNRLKLLYNEEDTSSLSRMKNSARKSFNNRINRLGKKHNYSFEIIKNENLIESFDRMVGLHKERFKSKNKETLLTKDNLEFLKKNMLESEDKFEILELTNENGLMASRLMIKDKDHYFCINGGFNPKYSEFSPMKILLNYTMDRGFNDLNLEFFDFGPGYEKYKYDWNPDEYKNYYSVISGTSIWSKLQSILFEQFFQYKLNKAVQ